jgi:hypothetical protein
VRWYWVAPVGSAVYFLIAVWPMLSDLDWFAPLLLVVAAVVAVAVALVFLLVATIVRRRRPSAMLLALALAAGLQAATPFEVEWDDGCNEHSSDVAAIAIPYVLLAEPELSYAPYADGSTDIDCG